MKASFLSAVVGAGLTHALPTIEAVGNKFFTSNGDQFFLKGKYSPIVPMLVSPNHRGSQLTMAQELPTN